MPEISSAAAGPAVGLVEGAGVRAFCDKEAAAQIEENKTRQNTICLCLVIEFAGYFCWMKQSRPDVN